VFELAASMRKLRATHQPPPSPHFEYSDSVHERNYTRSIFILYPEFTSTFYFGTVLRRVHDMLPYILVFPWEQCGPALVEWQWAGDAASASGSAGKNNMFIILEMHARAQLSNLFLLRISVQRAGKSVFYRYVIGAIYFPTRTQIMVCGSLHAQGSISVGRRTVCRRSVYHAAAGSMRGAQRDVRL
jgi:hypothetical protein